MKALHSLSVGLFSVACLLAPIQAIATPDAIAQRSRLPAYMDQFYNYLNDQKYTLLIGESRGACAYHVDPTDIYQQGTTRFLTAKITSGRSGTACRGYLELQILQVDCKTNILYQFQRETEGDPRFRGWQRRELSLYDPTQDSFPNVEQQSAQQICSLPVK